MRTRLGFVVRPAVAVLVALFAVCSSGGAARADEGMWTFDNFPSAKVGGTYGFTPSQAWLDHVRLSSVRLAFGCSGSFVSASGLVMTNHHCAQGCISQLSTGGKDYNRDGFYAASTAEEQRCPAQEIDQLLKIADVTAQIHAAEKGLTASAANAARKAQIARITQACDPLLRCDVVTLYNGGQYKPIAPFATYAWCGRPSSTSRSSAATRIIFRIRASIWTSRCCASTTAISRR
jgi:hypothetical protein